MEYIKPKNMLYSGYIMYMIIIYSELQPLFLWVLVVPDTVKWAQLAVDFENLRHVPNCIGSIDG